MKQRMMRKGLKPDPIVGGDIRTDDVSCRTWSSSMYQALPPAWYRYVNASATATVTKQAICDRCGRPYDYSYTAILAGAL